METTKATPVDLSPQRRDPETVHQEIVAALDAGEHHQAALIVDEAMAVWPNSTRLQLTKGEVLEKQCGLVAAALYFVGLLDERPAHRWALARLAPLLARSGATPAEAEEIAEALLSAKIEEGERGALLEALFKLLPSDAQLQFLQRLAPRSRSTRLEMKLAIAETERGNVDAALDLLTEARAQGRSNETTVTLHAELLATVGREREAIELHLQEIARNPERPDGYRRLLNLLQRVREFDVAGDIMQHAVERWPNDWMLVFRLNRLPIDAVRLRQIFQALSPTGDEAARKDDRYRLQFALACLHVGEIERARRLLREPFTETIHPLADPVKKALASRSDDFWLSGSRLKDDRTLDVQITKSPNSPMTVVVPTGIAFGFLPPAMFDSLFAAHRINVIYLRDFRKRAYTRGIVSLGRDEAETIRSLNGIIADLGTPRTVAMGCSMGGFAAMRYGALLGTGVAISFAGPTELMSCYTETQRSIWNPNYFIKLQLEREQEMPMDLLPVLSSAPDTRFFQFFGEEMRTDALQARRLDGLPNVTVMPVRGVSDHMVIDHMVADGSLDAILRLLMK